jgi:four helix bundle protein
MVSFMDLWIWKEAIKLMKELHDIANRLPKEERFKKKDQIERSSYSVADNIAEGYGSYYYMDKIKSFYVARKEAAEIQSHISSLTVKQYIDGDLGEGLIRRYEKLITGINGYIKYIRLKSGMKR